MQFFAYSYMYVFDNQAGALLDHLCIFYPSNKSCILTLDCGFCVLSVCFDSWYTCCSDVPNSLECFNENIWSNGQRIYTLSGSGSTWDTDSLTISALIQGPTIQGNKLNIKSPAGIRQLYNKHSKMGHRVINSDNNEFLTGINPLAVKYNARHCHKGMSNFFLINIDEAKTE